MAPPGTAQMAGSLCLVAGRKMVHPRIHRQQARPVFRYRSCQRTRQQPIINLTNSGYMSGSPRFALDGNAILFKTERYGMRAMPHGVLGRCHAYFPQSGRLRQILPEQGRLRTAQGGLEAEQKKAKVRTPPKVRKAARKMQERKSRGR